MCYVSGKKAKQPKCRLVTLNGGFVRDPQNCPYNISDFARSFLASVSASGATFATPTVPNRRKKYFGHMAAAVIKL